jgi:translation initiation factor 1
VTCPPPIKRAQHSTALVFSTETGRICPDCSQPVALCQCAANKRALAAGPAAQVATDGVLRVQRATEGAGGGKSVTLVRGLALDSVALEALAKQLKAACGPGGTVKDGVSEVQGDHVAVLVAALQKRGYVVKRVGG